MTTALTRQFRVFRGPSAVVTTIGPNVMALADFDGVHTGHQALLRRAVEAAAELGLPVGAATFEQRFDRRNGRSGAQALSGLNDRLALLREAGMDYVVLFPGNPRALGVPDDVFARKILLGVMKTQLVVVRDTGGGAAAAFGSDIQVDPIHRMGAGTGVSATRIRDRLGLGDIETVTALLGRRYQVTATARAGEGRSVAATVSASRMMPPAGDYAALVEYTSSGTDRAVPTTVTVAPAESGRPGLLHLEVDDRVDHGRLRIGFERRVNDLARAAGPRSVRRAVAPGTDRT